MSPELSEQLREAASKIGRYDNRDPFACLLGDQHKTSVTEIVVRLGSGGYEVTVWQVWGYIEGWMGSTIPHNLHEADEIDRQHGYDLGREHKDEWRDMWATAIPLTNAEGVPHELRYQLAQEQREHEATDFVCTQCGHLYPDHQGADNDVSDLCICNDCYAKNEGG